MRLMVFFCRLPFLLLPMAALSAAIPTPFPALELAPSGPNLIGHLRLTKDHPIDTSTVLYVQYALAHFREKGASFVRLDLDTPGGEVFAAMEIAKLLKDSDRLHHMPIVAYIDNWAISAGAMLAYSCRYIGATSSASMGAAEPVFAGEDGTMQTASEKVNSALRSEFANLARLWGRNSDVAEAMVDKDILLVIREGAVVRLQNESEVKRGDQILSPKGKLLTLTSKELAELGIAGFISDSFFEDPFFAAIREPELLTYSSWKIDFFAFLSHPAIASLLMMALLLGIYLEVQHPGLTFPLIIAGSALVLLGLSHFSMATFGYLEGIILALGLALLALELFVFSSAFLGVLGGLCILGALILLMSPDLKGAEFSPSWNLLAIAAVEKLAYLCGAVVATAILIFLFAKRAIGRFALKEVQEKEAPHLPAVGVEGEAVTPLMPSGKVRIAGRLLEAMSEGSFIDQGAKVAVLSYGLNAIIIVRKL